MTIPCAARDLSLLPVFQSVAEAHMLFFEKSVQGRSHRCERI